MDTLPTLIKLAEHDLDEKRQALVRLEDELHKLQLHKEALIKEEMFEKRVAKENLDAKRFYLNFLGRHKERMKRMDGVIKSTEEKILHAREEIRVAFGELKKYQILHDKRRTKEEEEARQEETKMLDDMGIESHLRKAKEVEAEEG